MADSGIVKLYAVVAKEDLYGHELDTLEQAKAKAEEVCKSSGLSMLIVELLAIAEPIKTVRVRDL